LSWSDGEPQCGGMHFRRGGKGSGRQGEKLLDAGVKLRGGGEQSVVAAAGFGGNAIGNLALHEDDDGLKVFRILEQAEKDVGGDVVGKVADDLHGLWTEFDA